jgi:hypothetical protein
VGVDLRIVALMFAALLVGFEALDAALKYRNTNRIATHVNALLMLLAASVAAMLATWTLVGLYV